MAASALLKSRVRRPSMLKKLTAIEDLDLVGLFPYGSYVGWSGFTGVGYPKQAAPQHHSSLLAYASFAERFLLL